MRSDGAFPTCAVRAVRASLRYDTLSVRAACISFVASPRRWWSRAPPDLSIHSLCWVRCSDPAAAGSSPPAARRSSLTSWAAATRARRALTSSSWAAARSARETALCRCARPGTRAQQQRKAQLCGGSLIHHSAVTSGTGAACQDTFFRRAQRTLRPHAHCSAAHATCCGPRSRHFGASSVLPLEVITDD